MKCQILFSGKKKKNILKCRLLQILPRVLSVKTVFYGHKIEQFFHQKLYHYHGRHDDVMCQ